MDTFSMVLIMLVIMGVVLAWKAVNRSQRDGTWASVAAELDLEYTSASLTRSPTLTGVVDGHRVQVSQYTTGGKNKTTWTRIRVYTEAPLPKGFHVKPQGIRGQFSKLLGGQDIEVGVPGFDALHIIKGDNEADVRDFMSGSDAARAIWALQQEASAEPEIRSHYLQFDRRGAHIPDLGRLIGAGVTCASSLASARREALERLRERGLTIELFRAHGIVDGEPVTVDVDYLEGTTTIRVRLERELPFPGVVRRGTCRIDDPILSRTIAIDGAHTDRWASLLSEEDLRDDLLTVVHGNPGSTVDATGVTLRLPSASHPALAEAVDDAVRLAKSLARATGSTSSTGSTGSTDSPTSREQILRRLRKT